MPKTVVIEDGKKECTVCHQWKTLEDEYNKSSKNWYGYQTRCRECDHAVQRTARERHITRTMISSARKRAKRADLPFNITKDDIIIPETCPVLGVAMNMGTTGDNRYSPSLDRITPELGYIPGNIQVISNKANAMKQDASPDELMQFANWVLLTKKG